MTERTWVAWAMLLGQAALLPSQEAKEATPIKAHDQWVHAVAYSPDGRTVASSSRIRTNGPIRTSIEIRLSDVKSGKRVQEFSRPVSHPGGLAFSPDGKMLAATNGPEVCLWDLSSGKELACFDGLEHTMRSLAFSPDGKLLTAAGAHKVWFWEIATRRERNSFRRKVYDWNCSFSPDLKMLASTCYQDLDVWDMVTGKIRMSLLDHRGLVSYGAFSTDGKTLAVTSNRLEGNGKYRAEVRLWDLTTGRERITYRGLMNYLWCAKFSPDDKFLALVGAPDLEGGQEIGLLDLSLGKVIHKQTFQKNNISPLNYVFRPDGKQLAIGLEDGTVRLWDIPVPPRKNEGQP